MLLVHGLSAYSGAWWRVGSRLAEHGCLVVAPDLRGHGNSPSTESYTFGEMAADLASLGENWDLIVGHSLGGPIACVLAAQARSCRAVLLLDPFLDAPDADFDDIVDGLLSELDPQATAESISGQHPSWHPEDCFHKAISARLTSRHVVEHCLGDNAPFHHLGLLDRLDVPITILGSDPVAGALFAPESMGEIGNPFVAYQMVDGAGHSLQRERPDIIVNAAIDLIRPSV